MLPELGTSTVSVVVCTHDEGRFDAMARAVGSLRAQTRPPDEIVLVVDQNPALLERVRRELPDLVVSANVNERGLSGARNTGISLAGGSLLGFLDDDATAAPDWLERLERLCRRPGVIGAGGRSDPRWLGERPEWWPDEFLWVVGCTYRGMPTVEAPVRNIYGGCFMMRREVLDEVGGFRVDLGKIRDNLLGCEETELCIRAARRHPGSTFLYDPDAVIEHDVPAGRTTWNYYRSRCFGEGKSKAILTRVVGAGDGLSSELAYSARALPLGVFREAVAGIRARRPARIARSAAIVAGFAATALGYVYGLARLR